MRRSAFSVRTFLQGAGLLLGALLIWDQSFGRHAGAGLSAPPARPAIEPAYPLGRWRLAPGEALKSVLLTPSHLLIRHRDAQSTVAFSLTNWQEPEPLPERSREQALALAEHLGRELHVHPERFAELAREHSEDSATRAAGGSLGSLSAFQLLAWPQLLDAFQALDVGEVSRVVETPFGFHLLRRRAPPSERVVTGARLVIGHDGARWLHDFQARATVPQRSHREALALARSLLVRAERDPTSFDSLVEQWSEARDAQLGGDIGTWSNREDSGFPREIEALATLPEGGVTLLESHVGIEILQRKPNRPRREFVATALAYVFNPAAAGDETISRASVSARARATAERAHRDPGLIAELQRTQCCPGVLRWREPDLHEWSSALAELRFGEVTAEPVESPYKLTILRRLDPADSPAPALSFELPAPEHPNIERIIVTADPEQARALLDRVARRAITAFGLDGRRAAWLLRLHEPWYRSASKDSPERRAAFDELQRSIRLILGDDRYTLYWAMLLAHYEALILTPATQPAPLASLP